MRASVSLGRIAGIPIGLHYSWVIIATLIVLSLSAHFQTSHPGWSSGVVWASAIATALLFFATLLAHELGHALVARTRGLTVRSITLFALGGVASIGKNAGSARTEFLMSIAGPLVSVAIGFGCIAAATALGWRPDEAGAGGPAAAILGWLGSINLLLAVFNLLPGYPLDGGRVLRALLWGTLHDADRATRIAAGVGMVVATIFIVGGMLRFLGGAGVGGLWLAFIGWFLLDAARASYADVMLSRVLGTLRAEDLMSRDCQTVSATTSLAEFVDRLVRTGQRCFIVTQPNGDVAGLITPHDVRGIDRQQWPAVYVRDAMRPLRDLKTVTPSTPVTDALAIMGREDINQVPVMDGGTLAGVLTRGNVLRAVQVRSELAA